VVVLRCRPDKLQARLTDRGESAESAAENAESEALDLILSETVNRHGEDAVYEIDTTDRSPESVAEAIDAVLAGEREPSAGTVSFVEYL
jgi:adenylate kinase